MFTGIIREVGKIASIRRGNPWRLTIEAPGLSSKIARGDSISVSGACLTAVGSSESHFEVEISNETIKRTNFVTMRTGKKVNLEPAITLQTALDGHIVQGHVDGTAKIVKIQGRTQKVFRFRPDAPSDWPIIEKASIAINGISLTIAEVFAGNEFSVSVIPLTLAETDLQFLVAGDVVNLEYDILGKYVYARMNNNYGKHSGIRL
ncbi:MAG: riboflavin synthase [bacterium]